MATLSKLNIQMIMVPLISTKAESFKIARDLGGPNVGRYYRGVNHHQFTLRPAGLFKSTQTLERKGGIVIRYGPLIKKLRSQNNPSAAIAEGMKLFGKFHGFEAGRVTNVQINTKIPGQLVQIGVLKEIVYHSDKDSPGKLKRYLHDFKKPFPVLCTDVKGNRLFILGGGYKVKAEGIVN